MAKKVSRRSKEADPNLEMIHFRPGAELGAMIGELASQFDLSRGEACKRLVSLAARGFDIEFYPSATELMELLYGAATFDEACHHLQAAVVIHARDHQLSQDLVEIPRETKKLVVHQYLENCRMMRGVQEEATQQRIRIHLTHS